MNRLEEKYRKEVVPSLMERHNYKTVMLVPKIEKIVVNMGVGDAIANSKNLEAAVADLEKITGLKNDSGHDSPRPRAANESSQRPRQHNRHLLESPEQSYPFHIRTDRKVRSTNLYSSSVSSSAGAVLPARRAAMVSGCIAERIT